MVAAAACSRMGWFFGLFDFCLQTRATASGESVGQTHKKVRLSDLRKAACRQALTPVEIISIFTYRNRQSNT